MSWLRLIRWSNLLIIFFTQLLVWKCITLPVSALSQQTPLLDLKNFLCLSFSTILIAAAGYIINDYFDIKIDSINRPEKMVLEKSIPRRLAIILHTVFNIVALLLAAIVARQAESYHWLLFQIACTLLLWFYSTKFKRAFAIGNVVVALLTALTIIVLILYEPALYYFFSQPAFISSASGNVLPNPIFILLVYTFFAFLLTWMREIVKDMEDFKGDEADGCMTMPIKWGMKKAESFTRILGVIALLPLMIAAIGLFINGNLILGIYTLIAIVLPVLSFLFYLPKSATTNHYSKASRYLKLIMVSGIGSLIIYYFQSNA